jgi:hypothetical protein
MRYAPGTSGPPKGFCHWTPSGYGVAAARLPGGRGVHKLDLPCNDADSPASADVAAHGADHAEKLRG